MNKTNILYCDYCSWKKIIRDVSNIDKNIIQKSQDIYKCPSCGRSIKLRKINDPQKELDLQIEKEKQQEELKNWMKETIEYREEFNNE